MQQSFRPFRGPKQTLQTSSPSWIAQIVLRDMLPSFLGYSRITISGDEATSGSGCGLRFLAYEKPACLAWSHLAKPRPPPYRDAREFVP